MDKNADQFIEYHQIAYLGTEIPILNNYNHLKIKNVLIKNLFRLFLEVLDTMKSDRGAITLRCPRGGRGDISPLQGLGQSHSRVLGAKRLARFI